MNMINPQECQATFCANVCDVLAFVGISKRSLADRIGIYPMKMTRLLNLERPMVYAEALNIAAALKIPIEKLADRRLTAEDLPQVTKKLVQQEKKAAREAKDGQ